MKYKKIKPWQKRVALFFQDKSNQTMIMLVLSCYISTFYVLSTFEVQMYFKENSDIDTICRFAIWATLVCIVCILALSFVFSMVKITFWSEYFIKNRFLFESDIERARELALRYPEKYGSEILRRIKKAQEADDAIHLVPYLNCIEGERRRGYGGSHSARFFGSYWV